ncbi:protein phosphatase 2C domain-containing protein [Streptomyces sp. NPDC098077]|uniref:protein phosphatase 2C domain-containing protein n=1 Tax=Streptomyces sp. NPDC098077 TaxID=3366093 RepID=UPI0037F1B227
MRVEIISDARGRGEPNEDFAAVALPDGGGALVVLDGVGGSGVGCGHGVPWFTARLGNRLLERSSTRTSTPLADCLAAAIESTADAHRAVCDLSHVQTPQSTVVAVRWGPEWVEYLVLSDSMLLLQSPDGTVRAVLDKPLVDLAPQVRARLDTLRRTALALPEGSPQAGAALREYTDANEALRNREGGFFTAAADPAAAAHAVTGSVPRSEVQAVAALTDGAGNWVETFGLGTWADCLAVLDKEGPRGLVARVRAAESTDMDGSAYQRDKPRDDASVVFVAFS